MTKRQIFYFGGGEAAAGITQQLRCGESGHKKTQKLISVSALAQPMCPLCPRSVVEMVVSRCLLTERVRRAPAVLLARGKYVGIVETAPLRFNTV